MPNNHQDLTSLINDFLLNLQNKGKSPNTLKNYGVDLRAFSRYMLEKTHSPKLLEFTLNHAQEFLTSLEKSSARSNSIRRKIQTLRMFFDYLIQEQVINDNPIRQMAVHAKVIDPPAPPLYKNILSTYIMLKENLQFALAETNHQESLTTLVALRDLILFHLVYSAGLKVSQLENLKLQAILPGEKNLYRVFLANHHHHSSVISIPLSEIFSYDFALYQKHLLAYQNKNSQFFSELFFNGNSYQIFSGGLSARGIELIFNSWEKKLKNKLHSENLNLTPKQLRQACIMKWHQQNVPDARIKEWMGVQPQYDLSPYKIKQNNSTTPFLEEFFYSELSPLLSLEYPLSETSDDHIINKNKSKSSEQLNY